MKIYVVGSCQAIPIAGCLALMLPDVQVERRVLFTDLSGVAEDGDIVFRQRENRSMTNAAPPRNEIVYPRFWFNAFHPDVVYTAGAWDAAAPLPLGADHSSLVLYGWQRGLSAAETAKLFCEPVFEQLGFFDCWDAGKRALLEEGAITGFPLEHVFERLQRHGCFMRSPNHPALVMAAEIARELAQRAGLPVAMDAPEAYLDDPMLCKAVWPVYPEIGARLGIRGAYAFKPAHAAGTLPVLLDLDEFIARAFDAYALMTPEALVCARLEDPAYRDLESVRAGERKRPRARATAGAREPSPYSGLPDERFWRRAVEGVPPSEIDPLGTPRFRIDRRTKIATAGSCFAQAMARALVRHGYDYFVAEPAPEQLSAEAAREAGYGVFSTRSGNVYTARQLLQLFQRAYGTFEPQDVAWRRPDGRFADPFRPQIEPNGFASVEELLAARARHLAAVRSMFEQLDVLIFTLGLTEAWRARADGAVFPLAPGVTAGSFDAGAHEFVNFTAAEVRDDLDAFLTGLEAVNPRARVALTVSPQPPAATCEPRHVVVSAAYTKAALRVAADEIERAWPNLWYVPTYELVAGGFNRGVYFEPDLRTVTPQGAEHVMRLFLAHCAVDEPHASSEHGERMLREHQANLELICDEEAIAFQAGARPLAGAAPQWVDFAWFRDFHVPVDLDGGAEPSQAVTMDALAPSSMRTALAVALPSELRTRTVTTVAVTVRNEGDAPLASGGKHPVFLCYRWFDAAGEPAEVGRSIHTALPAVLQPGAELALPMRIASPQHEGRYELRAALLQSEIAWFDDVDPANGARARVEVRAKVAFAAASAGG